MNKTGNASPGWREETGLGPTSVLHDCRIRGGSPADSETGSVVSSAGSAPPPPSSDLLSGPLLNPLPPVLQEMASCVKTTGVPISRMVELPSDGLGVRRVRASASPMGDGKGDSGVLLVLEDSPAGERFHEELSRLERLASLGTLSAGMAHEIRNALVAGRTFIELLIERNKDSELASIVQREMRRIESIATQMLRFGAPLRSQQRPLRLHSILERSLELIRPEMASRTICLDRSLAATHDLIFGDDYQLDQVFVNLCLNAIEAMGVNGTLRVSTCFIPGAPDRIEIAIQDSGSGISPEHLNRVFEPFFTTKSGGTGLGLHITRRIIEEHSGSIDVHSDLGKGATFCIRLPLMESAPHGNA